MMRRSGRRARQASSGVKTAAAFLALTLAASSILSLIAMSSFAADAAIGGGAGTAAAEVQIIVGSANLPPNSEAVVQVTIQTESDGVVATLNDLLFEPPLSIPEIVSAATTLAADIDADDVSIAVTDAAGLPDLGVVRIGTERVLYSGKSANVLTVAARGADGTTAAAHAMGSAVEVPTRVPNCQIAAGIAQLDKSAVFSYLPDGCTPDAPPPNDCQGVRAIVIGVSSFTSIPSGSTLYTCTVSSGSASGDFPLACPDGEKVQPPIQAAQASGDPDVHPAPFVTECADGVVHIVGSPGTATATPTETPTGPQPSASATPSSTPTATFEVETATPTETPPTALTATATPSSTSTATLAGATATPTATATQTATAAIATPTSTPTTTSTTTAVSASPTPTTGVATPTATSTPAACVGDCNDDQIVSVDELVRGINIALGRDSLAECEPADGNANDVVTIDEIVRAVSNAIDGCP
jgi:hypothetical protein